MAETNENRPVAIQVSGVKKMYRLGQIGGGTLQADLQSWWARVRGKEDPNTKIGEGERIKGQTFMALNGIDLTIYQGEAVGIIGSNGAGKSTLLKLLSKVTAPTEGEIDIYGRIASMLEVGTGFNGELTGRENVYMNGAILGMTKQEIDAKMEQIIEFSEVRDFIDTPVKRYSSGMFVKLAFSVAAHLDSEIMIMDEVLAVGDMAFQKKCLKKMREAAKQDGRTVLYVSHNMNTIRQLCDRCIVLDKGRIKYTGDVETAISIYLGSKSISNMVKYNFDVAPRPYTQHGKKIRLLEFMFCEKKLPVYERNEQILFLIRYKANESIDGLKLYLTVENEKKHLVGTSQIINAFRNVRSGECYEDKFVFNISNLSAGKYSFILDIYSDDDNGVHLSYDHPLLPVYFEIVDSHEKGLRWQSQFFGNVILNSVELYYG